MARRLLATQIGYQARLLASGRAITIGVGFPVILLIASYGSHTRTGAADIATCKTCRGPPRAGRRV